MGIMAVQKVLLNRYQDRLTLVVDGEPHPMEGEWTFASLEDRIAGDFNDYAKTLIWAGAIAGWKCRVLSRESVTLIAPDGRTVPLSTRKPTSQREFDKLRRLLMYHGDPVKVVMSQAYADGGALPDFTMEVEFEIREPKKHHPKPTPPKPKPPVRIQPKREVVIREVVTRPRVLPPVNEPHIVSERPFMSRYHHGSETKPGQVYPSDSIIERHWSDGSIDYRCALCEFSRPKMHGIRGHWQKHINDGTAEKHKRKNTLNTLMVEDPNYIEPLYHRRQTVYTPRSARVMALARFIESLPKDNSTEDTAEAVLQWIHEQSQAGSSVSAESEPLSDAEILDRVRRLVDRGEYLDQQKQMEELSAKVDSLYIEREDLLQRLQVQTQEARRARADLADLHELTAEWARKAADSKKESSE